MVGEGTILRKITQARKSLQNIMSQESKIEDENTELKKFKESMA